MGYYCKYSSITARPQFSFQVMGGVSNFQYGKGKGGLMKVEILPLESPSVGEFIGFLY